MAKPADVPPEAEDPTMWMIDNSLSEFLLMTTPHIRIMCMFGYTMFHGQSAISFPPLQI